MADKASVVWEQEAETTTERAPTGVINAAESPPADDTNAIDCDGYYGCRWDLVLDASTADIAITVEVLFWNSVASKWARGATKSFTGNENKAIVALGHGAKTYLIVKAFTGTTKSCSLYYTRWK